MCDPYSGREQTKAKHFILEQYLYALAFKVLSRWDELTYVDGFSGPWESATEDFSDTSFMIAIRVLKDVQQHYLDRGMPKVIKCFFVEKDPAAYEELNRTVMAHHDLTNGFLIYSAGKPFEDAVPEIMGILGQSFVLTFIDPTGWTGYPYENIRPLLNHNPGEALINMMYDFANRFASDNRPEIEVTFDPILGGPGWKSRLDPTLPIGKAVLKLFKDELRAVSGFRFVIETSIDRVLANRPHYFLTYGTRSWQGLKTFREVEYKALRGHETTRQNAQLDRRAEQTGQGTLFEIEALPNTIDEIVASSMRLAKAELVDDLKLEGRPFPFAQVCAAVLEVFMLRETNVKDICVELANEGVIEAAWRTDNKRKPHDHHMIGLKNP